ncbi:hypothetical protein GF357_01455 [Candidatus Dojkabacteria bacterium]|nr:hypothetical protein [Candidatus Dojkabacteria bacterium]
MIKKILKPFQDVLLKRRLCAGCTYPLDRAKKRIEYDNNKVMVQCKCKRRYILDKNLDSYKRMSLEEEKTFLNKIKDLG